WRTATLPPADTPGSTLTAAWEPPGPSSVTYEVPSASAHTAASGTTRALRLVPAVWIRTRTSWPSRRAGIGLEVVIRTTYGAAGPVWLPASADGPSPPSPASL